MTKISKRLDRHGESISDLRREVRDLVVVVRTLQKRSWVLGPAAERSEESAQ